MKLIRDKFSETLPSDKVDKVSESTKLNELFSLKIREILSDIKETKHKGVNEFADLLQAAINYASSNGFTHEQCLEAINTNFKEDGKYTNVVLTELDKDNVSNKIYFEK